MLRRTLRFAGECAIAGAEFQRVLNTVHVRLCDAVEWAMECIEHFQSRWNGCLDQHDGEQQTALCKDCECWRGITDYRLFPDSRDVDLSV